MTSLTREIRVVKIIPYQRKISLQKVLDKTLILKESLYD